MKWGCEARQIEIDGVEQWVDQAEFPWVLDDEMRWDCPARPWLDHPEMMSFLMEAYVHYQNGYLMETGSIMEQPVFAMKALAIISNQMVDCWEEKRRSEADKAEARDRAAALAQSRDGGRG